jgi:hypothetical protein
MNMNCHSELDDESQLVDAEGVAQYHMMTGSVNWAIALGRHDIQHAVSFCSALSHHHQHSSYRSSSNNGLIIPACTSIKLHATAGGNHKAAGAVGGVISFHHFLNKAIKFWSLHCYHHAGAHSHAPAPQWGRYHCHKGTEPHGV